MRYQCSRNPNHVFDHISQDGLCPNPGCTLEPLIPIDDPPGTAIAAPFGEPKVGADSGKLIEGLCLLVCDISASMDEPAFPDHPVTKLNLVAGAVKDALAELKAITKPSSAFVGIIAFGRVRPPSSRIAAGPRF